MNKSFAISNRLLELILPERAWTRSIKRVMEHYDMVKENNEKFFSSLYMHFIEYRIHEIFGQNKIKILDAGCGQGRLSIPLAKKDHYVTGIDLSPKVIDLARKYAFEEGIEIEFLTGDLANEIKKIKSEIFDCVICTEVLYMMKDYEMIIMDLVRLIKSGGILFLSLRPKLFYIMYCIANNNIEEAAKLVLSDNCYINDGRLNCQSKSEMIEMLKRNKLTDIELRGIGILSGIMGDPQSKFVVPTKLDKANWELLLKMEMKLSKEFCENGRYILISGIKK